MVTSGNVTKTAVTPLDMLTHKPHATCKSHSVIFYSTRVMGDESLHCRNQNFPHFFAPVTLTLTFIYDLTRTPWRYIGYANTNFLHQGFRKLLSDRHTYTEVTSGHVTKMVVTPFNPPHPKTPCYTQM